MENVEKKKKNPKNLYQREDSWFYDFRYEGKRYFGRLGPVNRTTATNALMKIKSEIIEGKFKPKKKGMDPTFEKFSEIYLPTSQNCRDRTSLNALLPFFGSKRLSEISPFLIEKYRQGRKETVAPATINLETKCLSHMFEMAINWGHSESNPARKVRKLKVNNERDRVLTFEEENRLLEAIDSNPKARHLKPMVILALNTGMRRGEILNLPWDQIDLSNRIITLLKTKNGKIRKIFANDTAMNVLRELRRKAEGQYVFPSLKEGAPFGSIRTGFETAVKKAGIKNFRFHDLRHSAATRMNLGGVDLPTIQEVLGHEDIRTTRRYAHPNQDSMRKAMETLDRQKSGKVTAFFTAPKEEEQGEEKHRMVSVGNSANI